MCSFFFFFFRSDNYRAHDALASHLFASLQVNKIKSQKRPRRYWLNNKAMRSCGALFHSYAIERLLRKLAGHRRVASTLMTGKLDETRLIRRLSSITRQTANGSYKVALFNRLKSFLHLRLMSMENRRIAIKLAPASR